MKEGKCDYVTKGVPAEETEVPHVTQVSTKDLQSPMQSHLAEYGRRQITPGNHKPLISCKLYL